MNVNEALTALYSPTTSSDVKREAQEWLQKFQTTNDAWSVAGSLLHSQTAELRFFGAHTFQLKLARDWDTLNGDSIVATRDLLMDMLVETSGGPAYVTTKLCTALTAYAFKACPDLWERPISAVATRLQTKISDQSISMKDRYSVETTLLEFFTILPEELQNSVFSSEPKRVKFFAEIRRDIPLVFQTVLSVLSTSAPEDPTDNVNSSELKRKALGCILSWSQLQEGIPMEYIGSLIDALISHLPVPATFESSAKVLSEVLSLAALRHHEDTVCNGLLPVLTTGWVRDEFSRGFEDRDPSIIQPLSQLFAVVGETFPKFIIKNLERQDVLHLLEMVLMCTGFPGFFGVDEELSDTANALWFELQETLTEGLVVPRPGSHSSMTPAPDFTTDPATGKVIFKDSAKRTMFDLRHVQRSSDVTIMGEIDAKVESGIDVEALSVRIWGVATVVFSQLLSVVRQKVQRPNAAVWSSWSVDCRERFRNYRTDMSEVICSCFKVLGPAVHNFLLPTAVQQIESIVTAQTIDHEESLEATLFVVKALAEDIDIRYSPHLQFLFGDSLLGRISSFDARFFRVRTTMCQLIGADRHPKWLAFNPGFLLPAVNFLLTSIGDSRTVRAAVDSLDEVCEHSRKHLAAVAADMVSSWSRFQSTLQSGERSKLLRAISKTLQPLPQRAQLPLVVDLISPLVSDARTALGRLAELREAVGGTPAALASANAGLLVTGDLSGTTVNTDSISPEVAEAEVLRDKSVIVECLRLLKAVCDGLQKPERDFDVIVDDDDNDRTLVITDNALPPKDPVEPLDPEVLGAVANISDTVWQTVGATFETFLLDQGVIEVLTNFIRATFFSETQGVFTAMPEVIGPLLTNAFEASRGSTAILETIKALTQTVLDHDYDAGIVDPADGTTPVRVWMRGLLTEVLGRCVRELSGNLADRTDLAVSMFSLMSKNLHGHPWSLLSIPETILSTIFNSIVPAALEMQDRLGSTAAISFLQDWVSYSPPAVSSSTSPSSVTSPSKLGVNPVTVAATVADARRTLDAVTMAHLRRDENSKFVAAVMRVTTGIGFGLVRLLLAGMAGGQPTSLLPQETDLLFRLIRAHPNEFKAWLIEALREPGFPSQTVTDLDKEALVNGVLGARAGLRQFRDLLKPFVLKCRNLLDTAYGQAIRL